MATTGFVLTTIAVLLSIVILLLPAVIYVQGKFLGWSLRRRSLHRRELLLGRVAAEEREYSAKRKEKPRDEDDDWERIEGVTAASSINGGKGEKEWEGIVGFFHPFCNAGGGGERVLWAAIRATQRRWPKAICVVYTGDHDADKSAILHRVQDRFNIHLHPPNIIFLYLSYRYYVLSSTWPYFTLLGQSLGSIVLAYDAFSLLVPEIFIDTMGYAFTLGFSKWLFPDVPTGAYVHYPTISTDMLGSLDEGGNGMNAGAGRGWKGAAKRKYWHLFAQAYGWVGGNVDVVMTNSSWTQAHVQQLWGPQRRKHTKSFPVSVVFPPVAVEELEDRIEVNEQSERTRTRDILYIAQFRPEKNHQLIVNAFASLILSQTSDSHKQPRPKLILIGSVRDKEDSTRVYKLRLLAHELKIKEDVEFICDATWPQIQDWLQKASIGVNGMWNEHFGIGVVEYQAAGLISVVHNSGGPKEDIVIDIDGKPTGFYATTAEDYKKAFTQILNMSSTEILQMRIRARESAKRFTEERFASKWLQQMTNLIELQTRYQPHK
ncbi:glycosyltransferase family 4 protein [Patellaria atrata CBS 101060]|uniref:GDP-Man:Man(3)GlcNAc(2)-PP-Dol alpha-1,2-mannosyltransferase n=1 Tax=Patellaria atrata CBS 101060 TaxID=1346257 RepID=A0A9P4SDN1_9PEZI|nr:glycosyltransferase family 4 protein [Patellaria atrata CBS 101060]